MNFNKTQLLNNMHGFSPKQYIYINKSSNFVRNKKLLKSIQVQNNNKLETKKEKEARLWIQDFKKSIFRVSSITKN